MENNKDIIDILNDKDGWAVQNGCDYHSLENRELVYQIKNIADENIKLRKFFRFSQGHLPVTDISELAEEIKVIKEKYPKLEASLIHIFDDIIDTADYLNKLINDGNIDSYFNMAGDLWFFPGGIMGVVHFYRVENAVNLQLEGKQLYEFLRTTESHYGTLTALGVVPKFTEEEILDYSKRLVSEYWSAYVKGNKKVVENRLNQDFNRVANHIKAKKYEDKYRVYYIYIKYTPSDEVVQKVREHAEAFFDSDELKELEIIFMASEHEGFDGMRKLFKDEKYKFTGEEIKITFE